jgi:hypothetical protein
VVRDLPQRAYNPVRRCWTIPVQYVDDAVEDFAQMGFAVRVKGRLQSGDGSNPFACLKASTDPVT